MASSLKVYFLLLTLILGNSFANDLKVRDGFYRLSYDGLTLPSQEELGLFGTNYLLYFDNSYLGLGVYSAVDGQRGGFFTGGVELGHQFAISDDLLLDGGLFIGGGGGGSAPQGGGLMLRPHLNVVKVFNGANVGLGVSKVKFPNGDIDSDQLNLQLDIPFGFIYKGSVTNKSNNNDVLSLSANNKTNVGWKDHYIAATYQQYMIDSGVNHTSGLPMTSDMNLVGFEYGTQLGQEYYSYMETAGSGSNDTDGFAELLGGVGYSKDLGRNFGFNIKAALGAAGGGNVDTGGGFIHKQAIGLYIRPFDKISLSAELGRVGAFDGAFKATTAKISLQYPFKLLSAGSRVRKASNYDYTADGLWGVRAINQTYLGSDTLRKNGLNDSVQLLGVKLDRYLDDDTYLTGQALAAYQGKAGGYAVGLLGIGQEFDITNKLSLSAEINAGVAGGGGINTGGSIIQPMLGLNYKLNSDVSLQASIGRLQAIKNGGQSNVIDFGIRYQFKTVE